MGTVAAATPRMSELPVVTINATVLPTVVDRIRDLSRASVDGNETGGILLGRGPDERGLIVVERAGEPGENAERKPNFFLRDRAHAQRLADEAWRESGAVWVGEWHTHPTGLPTPSPQDLATYSSLLADPELAFQVLVSVIAIPDPDEGWEQPRLLVWVLQTGTNGG
jgi:integrative and conjugative element protein (TIGR02256 family)